MTRKCWTCQGEHDPDEACETARAPRASQASADFDDADSTDFGPVFMALFESDCSSCEEVIHPGEDIRAVTGRGYIHADDECEKIARLT